MIATQNLKYVNAMSPVSLEDAVTITSQALAVDTIGYNSVAFVLSMGASDVAAAAFSLTESDTAGGSYTAVPLSTPGTLLTATDDNDLNVIHLNLRNAARKRFYKIVLTTGSGTVGTFSCIAVLGDPAIAPNSGVDRGLNANGYEVLV